MDAIGEDESAFGVGIEDFDRFAGHSSLDVAGLLGFCRRACFGGRHDADHLDAGLQRGKARMTPSMVAPPAMSYFIFSMPSAGLMEMPPVSKVTAFADEADHWRAGFQVRGRISDDHDAGRLGTALGDAEKRAHLGGRRFSFVENFNGEASFPGHGLPGASRP